MTAASFTQRHSNAAGPGVDLVRQPGARPYLLGYTLDVLVDGIWLLVIAWEASRSGGATAGFVLALASAPRAVFMLFGGVIADRMGIVRATHWSFGARLVLFATFAGYAIAPGHVHVAFLAVFAAAFGLIDGLHLPAVAALPTKIFSRKDLAAAQALRQILLRVATAAGAPLAGLLLALGGSAGIGVIGTTLLLIAWLSVLRVPLRPHRLPHDNALGGSSNSPGASLWADTLAGANTVWTDRILSGTLILVTVTNLLCIAPIVVGIPLLGHQEGWSPLTVGVVTAGFAVGATLGALSLLLRRTNRPIPVASAYLVGTAACLMLLGLSTNPAWVGTATLLMGITVGPASALLIGEIQARTPPDHEGRVMSLVEFSSLGLTPVGFISFGLLSESFGQQSTTLLLGVTQLIVSGSFLVLTAHRHTSARRRPSDAS